MKIYWTLLLFLLAGMASPAWAQDEDDSDDEDKEKPSLKERLYYSGGFDLQFGDATVIGFYPTVGYKFNEVLSAGVGLSYQFSKFRAGTYIVNGIPYSVASTEPQHTYGGKVFGRAKTPIRVFLHAEWETLNAYIPVAGLSRGRAWYDALLVGAGYSAVLGNGAASMNIMMLYNLNRSANDALYRSEFVPRIEFAYNF